MCIQRVDGMKYVSTFFELDFDTPWDHKILQESLRKDQRTELDYRCAIGCVNSRFMTRERGR